MVLMVKIHEGDAGEERKKLMVVSLCMWRESIKMKEKIICL